MKGIQTTISLTLITILLAGCDYESLPKGVKIQINVPDEPYPGTRTQLITYDVVEGRDTFQEFFRAAKRVGMCSPTKIENDNSAHEVMSISFWGKALKHRLTFYLLKNQQGEWITTGYGGVETYDDPEGFPQYVYSQRSLNRVKEWYEKHVPEKNRIR
jgi:hypothetical protein